jgi:opacity protein-like surface antigen
MCRVLVIAALLAAATPPARAAESPQFQIAAHAGYRAGGSFEDGDTGDDRDLDEGESFAVALELRYRPGDDRFFQLWYSRQASAVEDELDVLHDVDIEYLHLGGTVPLGSHGSLQPYFAAGLGATRFSASGPDSRDQTKFSGSAALGFAVPVAEHAALRFEARGYLTAVDTDTAFFCRTDGGEGLCRIVSSGSTVFQAEALVGIAVRF